ncbi:nucleotidyl transferase AbiEii/AbiGii toxin family protein [soil metagenome]
MIPRAFITEWRARAPWAEDAQIEQDLVLSRVLVEIFSDRTLAARFGFRGGTALNKLHLDAPSRYSEDIDLVQLVPGPIGEVVNPLQELLEDLLGNARVSLRKSSARLTYRFESETEPIVPLRLKIEIDTREHEPTSALVELPFTVESGWFSGATAIPTYPLDELMGTKLRALYQRRKGRDLFDLWLVIERGLIDPDAVVRCFLAYLEGQGLRVSRAEFEENLYAKVADGRFLADVAPLLRDAERFDPEAAFAIVMKELIARIPGDAWKGTPG